GAGHGNVSIVEGGTAMYYSPDQNFFGSDSCSYTVSDMFTGSDTARVFLTVTPVNDAPVITSSTQATAQVGSIFTYYAAASDPDDDPLAFAFAQLPAWLTVAEEGILSGIPAEEPREESFLVCVTDGSLSDTGTVTVTIEGMDVGEPAPLVAVEDTAHTPEDMPVLIPVLLNDVMPAGIKGKILWIGQGIHGNACPAEGDTALIYTPAYNYFGPDSLLYAMGSATGSRDTARVYVMITPVNDPPVVTSSASVSARVDSIFIYVGTGSDPEGDPLTFSFLDLPGWLLVTGSGELSGIPLEGPGEETFTVVAQDGSLSDSLEVTITIQGPVVQPVIALNDTAFTREDEAVLIPVLANDLVPTGIGGRILWLGQGSLGDACPVEGDTAIIYTPAPDIFGQDTLCYSVGDEAAGLDTAFIYVVIDPINDPPSIFDLLAPISGTTVALSPLDPEVGDSLGFVWETSCDVDGDSLVYILRVSGDLSHVLAGDLSVFPGVNWNVNELRDGLAMLGVDGMSGTWDIIVTDGHDSTASGNGPFVLSLDGSTLATEKVSVLPERFTLGAAFPNPFNAVTTLPFSLPAAAQVSLKVYDLRGKLVRELENRYFEAGFYSRTWNGLSNEGTEVSSGYYTAILQAGALTARCHLILVR
ncbi:Ig-like domain-containing protein, partial [Candidatus Neomarinimicrobiota bacterium]